MAEKNALKRNPGSYLRRRSLKQGLLFTAFALVGLSWLIPLVILWFLVHHMLLTLSLKLILVLFPGVLCICVALVLMRRLERGQWRIDNMLKGADAEERIGHAIEWALSSYACAVAHNVMVLENDRDIDHLVATPEGLWVIETKANRVDRKYFNGVLRSIVRKVDDVRHRWPNINVTGCLVFANDAGEVDDHYDYDDKSILCFPNPDALAHALRHKARKETSDSTALATSVWKLSVDLKEVD